MLYMGIYYGNIEEGTDAKWHHRLEWVEVHTKYLKSTHFRIILLFYLFCHFRFFFKSTFDVYTFETRTSSTAQ